MMDTYEGRKVSWSRPPGRPLNVWLNKIEEDANALLLSTLWRSEIARDHGAAQRLMVHSDYATMMMMMRMTGVKNGG